jgi:hypothetical protein
MLRRKRLAIGDEGKEAPDCCQTAVPCPDRGLALLFNMLQERQHFRAYEILQAAAFISGRGFASRRPC